MIDRLNLLFIIGVATVFCSCKTSCEIGTYGDEIGPEPRIVKGEAKRTVHSLAGSDSTEFVIDYEYFSRQNSSFVMDSSFKDSVNTIIYEVVKQETFSEVYDNVEPITKHFFSAQLDSLAKVYESEEDGDEHATLWDLEMSIGIQDFSSFVVVTLSGWSYTGGAHGNGYFNYRKINLKDGIELGTKDFFTDVDALNVIAEPYFRALFELSAEESLNEYGFWFYNDEFSVNENFTFSGDDIVFYYNSYEIAPYAGGPTELIVPMEKIKHLLKREL